MSCLTFHVFIRAGEEIFPPSSSSTFLIPFIPELELLGQVTFTFLAKLPGMKGSK